MGVFTLFIVFLSLMFLSVPVAFSLVITSMVVLLLKGDIPIIIIAQRMVNGLDNFTFLCLPLFILSGQLMNKTGITDDIFDFASSIVGHIKGGLGHVNVLASMIFAGISGLAQADVASLGAIEMRSMVEKGYEKPFSAAITAVSSIIGPIIPPSVIMAFLSMIVGVSLARLFLAGFIPGILMGISLMVTIYIQALRGKVKGEILGRQPFMVILKKFLKAFPALLMPVFLVFGLLAGIATPTEIGAVTFIYSLILGAFYKKLKFSILAEVFKETLLIMGMMVFILSCAFPFGWLVTINNIPNILCNFILFLSLDKWIILLLINIVLLIMGSLMECTTILLIMTPVLFPIMLNLGLNPIHCAMIIIINLLIGGVTPPFGILVFVAADVAKLPIYSVFKEVIIFLIPLLFILFLVTYAPEIVLFLPNLILK